MVKPQPANVARNRPPARNPARPGMSARPDRLVLDGEALAELRYIVRTSRQFRAMVRRGAEPEDLHQEVVARLLHGEATRNVTYNPDRATVGAYLQTRADSILAHMTAESRTMKRAMLSTGVVVVEDGETRVVDAAQAAISGTTIRPAAHAAFEDLARAVLAGRPTAEVRRLASRLVAEHVASPPPTTLDRWRASRNGAAA